MIDYENISVKDRDFWVSGDYPDHVMTAWIESLTKAFELIFDRKPDIGYRRTEAGVDFRLRSRANVTEYLTFRMLVSQFQAGYHSEGK